MSAKERDLRSSILEVMLGADPEYLVFYSMRSLNLDAADKDGYSCGEEVDETNVDIKSPNGAYIVSLVVVNTFSLGWFVAVSSIVGGVSFVFIDTEGKTEDEGVESGAKGFCATFRVFPGLCIQKKSAAKYEGQPGHGGVIIMRDAYVELIVTMPSSEMAEEVAVWSALPLSSNPMTMGKNMGIVRHTLTNTLSPSIFKIGTSEMRQMT